MQRWGRSALFLGADVRFPVPRGDKGSLALPVLSPGSLARTLISVTPVLCPVATPAPLSLGTSRIAQRFFLGKSGEQASPPKAGSWSRHRPWKFLVVDGSCSFQMTLVRPLHSKIFSFARCCPPGTTHLFIHPPTLPPIHPRTHPSMYLLLSARRCLLRVLGEEPASW